MLSSASHHSNHSNHRNGRSDKLPGSKQVKPGDMGIPRLLSRQLNIVEFILFDLLASTGSASGGR
jgi:hypothetical protein